jgi:hypothetical protein
MSQETKLGCNLAGYSIRVLTLALAVMTFGLGVWNAKDLHSFRSKVS